MSGRYRKSAYHFTITNSSAGAKPALDILIIYLANLCSPYTWDFKKVLDRQYRIIACGITFSELDRQDPESTIRDVFAEVQKARAGVTDRKCICVAHSLSGVFLQQLLVLAYERELPGLTTNFCGLILFGTPQQDGKSSLLKDILDGICEALGKHQPGNYRSDKFVYQIRKQYVDCFPRIPVLACIERGTTVGGLTLTDEKSSCIGLTSPNCEYFTHCLGDHWSCFSSENCQIALKQLFGLLNAQYTMASTPFKGPKRERRPSTPVIMGARYPSLDVYAARRDKGIYSPPPFVYALVILPINLLSFFLINFRYKYSQTDFALSVDITILSVLLFFYTACLSMLLHSIIMGVRPGPIVLIILQAIVGAMIVARKDILTVLFVGLPLSLTMAMDFVCFAPMCPPLRSTRARHWIWQPWLQEHLLALTRNEVPDSVELDKLPAVRARENFRTDEAPSRRSTSDLGRVPISSTLRRPRSWSQLPFLEA